MQKAYLNSIAVFAVNGFFFNTLLPVSRVQNVSCWNGNAEEIESCHLFADLPSLMTLS